MRKQGGALTGELGDIPMPIYGGRTRVLDGTSRTECSTDQVDVASLEAQGGVAGLHA